MKTTAFLCTVRLSVHTRSLALAKHLTNAKFLSYESEIFLRCYSFTFDLKPKTSITKEDVRCSFIYAVFFPSFHRCLVHTRRSVDFDAAAVCNPKHPHLVTWGCFSGDWIYQTERMMTWRNERFRTEGCGGLAALAALRYVMLISLNILCSSSMFFKVIHFFILWMSFVNCCTLL